MSRKLSLSQVAGDGYHANDELDAPLHRSCAGVGGMLDPRAGCVARLGLCFHFSGASRCNDAIHDWPSPWGFDCCVFSQDGAHAELATPHDFIAAASKLRHIQPLRADALLAHGAPSNPCGPCGDSTVRLSIRCGLCRGPCLPSEQQAVDSICHLPLAPHEERASCEQMLQEGPRARRSRRPGCHPRSEESSLLHLCPDPRPATIIGVGALFHLPRAVGGSGP